MRLLVVSNMPHYRRGDEIVGWGPTVIELDEVHSLFDEVTHIAEIWPGEAPRIARSYRSPIRMILLPGRGGEMLWQKFFSLLRAPRLYWTFLRALRRADALHLRCPGSLGLLTMLLFPLIPGRRPRWIKFAGNWRPDGADSLSYRFERWWLRKPWSRAVVTVNGEWPDQPPHIRPFLNPCLDDGELAEGAKAVATKPPLSSLRMLYVGNFLRGKGVHRVVEIAARLRDHGLALHLDLVGDGAERHAVETAIVERGLEEHVTLHGWLDRQELPALYAGAHLILLPSQSEGWPKVLSEAMAFGVVPLASSVSSIPQVLEKYSCGRALPACDIDAWVEALEGYVEAPATWASEAARASSAAADFSYRAHVERLRGVFGISAPPGEARTMGRSRMTQTTAD